MRSLSFAALGLTGLLGCGGGADDRPATLEYVTLTVLAPTCGRGGCHSSATARAGLAFDGIDATRATLRDEGELVVPGRPERSELVEVLTDDGEEAMPPEGPLADGDIDLIVRWIEAGAPGLAP